MKVASLALSLITSGIIGIAAGAESDTTAVLDDTTLWRQFQVQRCSFVRKEDGVLQPCNLSWKLTHDHGIVVKEADPKKSSPLPPVNWADPALDDTAWPRVLLPQPALRGVDNPDVGGRRKPSPYDTTLVLLRGKFLVKDLAQVKEYTLSLDYWGGVVVYVNGKELVRGDMPDGAVTPATVAKDYPVEAFTTKKGTPLCLSAGAKGTFDPERLVLRDRKLQDVKIPSALLRQGVNVLAIEVHAAPVHIKGIDGAWGNWNGWPPIGLLEARLTASSGSTVVANVSRPRGIQVWNAEVCDQVSPFDYGDPAESLRPVVINAARNSVYSGRLMVGSDQPIKGLKVTVSELVSGQGSTKIPASAVRVRCAVPATAGKSWMAPYRFDGLFDTILPEIPVVEIPPPFEWFYDKVFTRNGVKVGGNYDLFNRDGSMMRGVDPAKAGAMAPLWITVRVPKDAAPGLYEGKVIVSAEGLNPVTTSLRVNVSAWTMPDPKDFRVCNFLHISEDSIARHYEVPLWSEKHLAFMGQTLALLSEVNSRHVMANLTIDFNGDGANAESLIRWVKKQDGTFTQDYSVFDKFLEMVDKSMGKPFPLRLNFWSEMGKGSIDCTMGGSDVSVLDLATGKLGRLSQPGFRAFYPGSSGGPTVDPGSVPIPVLGAAENLVFWRPVFEEMRKKLKARGWLDAVALGYTSHDAVLPPAAVDVARQLWPEGVWYFTSHAGKRDVKFLGTDGNSAMPVRFVDTVWASTPPAPRGARALLQPMPEFFCSGYRSVVHDYSPLSAIRAMEEDMILSGMDGVSDFGGCILPVKRPLGGYYLMQVGRGTSWGVQGRSILSLLYPGPDGLVASEKYEAFREGLEAAEAILFLERAIQEKKLSTDLQKRAEAYLDARGEAFCKFWYTSWYMQSEEDAKLLSLAGEVAKETQR